MGTEYGLASLLPLDKGVDDRRVDDAFVAGTHAFTYGRNFIQKVALTQIFLQHLARRLVDSVDLRHRQAVVPESLGIIHKVAEIVVDFGTDLQNAGTLFLENTEILASRARTRNRGNGKILGIAARKQIVFDNRRNLQGFGIHDF